MEKNPTFMRVVAAALQSDSGLWLMHKRPLEKHHGGLWEFPGGKIEGLEAPENALIRELHEELAIDVKLKDLVFVGSAQRHADSHQPAIVIELYSCTRWGGDPDPQEGGETGWFTFEEMRALPKPPLDHALLDELMQKHAR